MKNISRYILFGFILLIVIGGFLLLIFNDRVVVYVRTQAGLVDDILKSSVITTPVPASETINAQVLSSPLLATLVNQVVNFNFDNICWRPDTVLSRSADLLVATSTTATSTVSVNTPVKCAPGNGLPFLVKNK